MDGVESASDQQRDIALIQKNHPKILFYSTGTRTKLSVGRIKVSSCRRDFHYIKLWGGSDAKVGYNNISLITDGKVRMNKESHKCVVIYNSKTEPIVHVVGLVMRAW